MANTAKMAILRAKVDGIVNELMLKTNIDHVYVDDTTTLATKLATLAAKADLESLQQAVNALGALAKKDKIAYADLESALAALIDGKAEASALTDEIARAKAAEEANAAAIEGVAGRMTTAEGKIDTMVGSDTGKSIRTIANEELAAQLIGENAQESLDTLGEIAAWIQNHPGDASAMNAAITALQNKVDTGDKNVSVYVSEAIAALKIGDYAKAADLTALAGRVEALETTAGNLKAMAFKDIVAESDLDAALAEKVNASAQANHSHANKELLDSYTQTEANLADAVAKKHEHINMSVLNGISAANVSSWNNKAKVYAADAVVDLGEGEIYVQLV